MLEGRDALITRAQTGWSKMRHRRFGLDGARTANLVSHGPTVLMFATAGFDTLLPSGRRLGFRPRGAEPSTLLRLDAALRFNLAYQMAVRALGGILIALRRTLRKRITASGRGDCPQTASAAIPKSWPMSDNQHSQPTIGPRILRILEARHPALPEPAAWLQIALRLGRQRSLRNFFFRAGLDQPH